MNGGGAWFGPQKELNQNRTKKKKTKDDILLIPAHPLLAPYETNFLFPGVFSLFCFGQALAREAGWCFLSTHLQLYGLFRQ